MILLFKNHLSKMIKQVTDYIKTKGYIPLNYTSKLKSFDDVIYFINYKMSEEKYKNIVFIVETDNIPTNMGQLSFQETVLECIPENDRYEPFIVIFNNSVVKVIRPEHGFNTRAIDDLLNQRNATQYPCCVCLEKKSYLRVCATCTNGVCQECFDKMIDIQRTKLIRNFENDIGNEIDVNCPCCRKAMHKLSIQ